MGSSGNILPFPGRGQPEVGEGCPPSDQEITRAFDENRSRLIAFLSLRLGSITEAQDAAQSVFMRLWQRREEMREGNLTSMMFVAARNYAIDQLRARSRHRATFPNAFSEEVAEMVRDESPLADRVLNARQELKLVRAALGELPEKCRIAFFRYKFEDAAYAEIAQELSVTESMVRKYVLRAMAHCAARFAELEGWE